MLSRFRTLLDEKLIMPFRESHAPVEEVARGTVVGLIWALTPLVGIQMYLVLLTWTIARFVRYRFSLTVGIALVWITNPLTMGFFYYGFYETGRFFLEFVHLMRVDPITMDRISQLVDIAGEKSLIDGLIYWSETFMRDFGIPSLIGGFIWGILSSIVAYPATVRLMNNHRQRLAEREGITLSEWEEKHIHGFVELVRQKRVELPPYSGLHAAPENSVPRAEVVSRNPVRTAKKKTAKSGKTAKKRKTA